MSSENEQQPARPAGRHAAPRPTVRGRMQRPVGRAIALTAMPTALLMGILAPKLAFAADGAAKVAPKSAPDLAGTTGATCTKGAPGTGTGATTPATGSTTGTTSKSATTAGKNAPHAGGSATSVPTQRGGTGSGSTSGGTGTGSTSGGTGGSTGGTSGGGSTGGTGGGTGTGGTPTPAPSPTQSTPSDPLGGILGGLLGGLLGGHTASGTTTTAVQPSASASASPQAHVAAARTAAVRDAATPAPSTSATPASVTPTPSATPSKPTTTPSASASSTPAPTASATPNGDPNKPCDISHLAAPLDTSVSSQLAAGTMPVEKWTLKSSDLKLINTEFHGVVTVPLADGSTQRVLKFTAEEVNIGDLDMSANQHGQEVHVQGSPGSTSTMRGGTVTMYVTELKGTVLAAEGIPLSLLNINIDLTPDTLPQWLYNLIGAVPIPLTLELGDVTAIQQGQFGGNLTIPGMHLFYTPLSQ